MEGRPFPCLGQPLITHHIIKMMSGCLKKITSCKGKRNPTVVTSSFCACEYQGARWRTEAQVSLRGLTPSRFRTGLTGVFQSKQQHCPDKPIMLPLRASRHINHTRAPF